MKGINKVTILGSLGADPETRHTQSGKSVTNFRVATSEKWKDRDGNPQERTEWHSCVAWGPVGDVVARYLTKGSPVYLEGSLQTRKWQGQDGQDRYTTAINVRDVVLLPPGKGGASEPKRAEPKRDAGPPPADFDDEIPF